MTARSARSASIHHSALRAQARCQRGAITPTWLEPAFSHDRAIAKWKVAAVRWSFSSSRKARSVCTSTAAAKGNARKAFLSGHNLQRGSRLTLMISFCTTAAGTAPSRLTASA